MSDTADRAPAFGPPETPENLSRRVFSSTVWNYAGHGATLLTWFLLTPFVVAELGPQGYGLFVVATAVMGYGQLLELGLSAAVIRFSAELHERDDLDELRAIVATAFAIACTLCVVAIAIAVVVAPLAPDLLHIPADERETTQRLVVVAAATAGIAFPSATLFALLMGLQRFDISNILQAIATLLLAGFTIAALLMDLGVEWVVGAGIPASVMIQIPALIAIRRARPGLRLLSGRPRARYVRQLFSFSWAIIVMQGAGTVKTRTDEILIAAMLPVAQVTPYALARRTSEAPVLLTYQFSRVILPLAAQLGARNEHDRLRAVFLTGTRLTLAAYLACACALTVMGGPFLAAWVGEEYRSAASILVVLAIAAGIEMAKWTADQVLQGISKHRPLAFFAILGAVMNLGLSIVLISRLGPIGAAYGTLIATFIEVVLLILPFSMRRLEIGGRAFVHSVLLPTLVPAIPATAVALGLTWLMDPASFLSIILIGLVTAGAYVGTYFTFAASAPERTLALAGSRAVVGRIRRTANA